MTETKSRPLRSVARAAVGIDYDPQGWTEQLTEKYLRFRRMCRAGGVIFLLTCFFFAWLASSDTAWFIGGCFTTYYLCFRLWTYLVWTYAHPHAHWARKTWPALSGYLKIPEERWVDWMTPEADAVSCRTPHELALSDPNLQRRISRHFAGRVGMECTFYPEADEFVARKPFRIQGGVDLAELATRYPHLRLGPTEIALGIRLDGPAKGTVFTADIGEKGGTPHWTMSAGPNGGKSTFLRSITAQILARAIAEVDIVDLRTASQNWVRTVPGARLHQTPAEAAAVIREFLAEMKRRYKILNASDFPDEVALRFTRRILIIEEGNTFSKEIRKAWKKIKGKRDLATPPTLDELEDISNQGRQCGMHLISAYQEGNSYDMGGSEIKSNSALRVLAACSWQMFKNMTGRTPPWDGDYEKNTEVGAAWIVKGAGVGELAHVQLFTIDERPARAYAIGGTLGAVAEPEPEPEPDASHEGDIDMRLWTIKEASCDEGDPNPAAPTGRGILPVTHQTLKRTRSRAREGDWLADKSRPQWPEGASCGRRGEGYPAAALRAFYLAYTGAEAPGEEPEDDQNSPVSLNKGEQ